ncbi:MAG: type II toxin-antitoxin system HicA family toxin [Pseudomonadota bacterium]
MTKRNKLIAKALNNPKGLSFEDFQQLLRSSAWTFDHQRGSHQIWYSPTGHRLSIQQGRDGKAKGYQVEQFMTQLESEDKNAENGSI